MKKFIPTDEHREKVRMLRCCGVAHERIASVLQIGVRTLEKHFREELSVGLAEANAQIAGALYRKALEGDTTAMIFWLKSRAGWKETVRHESDGPGAVLVIDTSDRPDPRFPRNDAPAIEQEPSLSKLLGGG